MRWLTQQVQKEVYQCRQHLENMSECFYVPLLLYIRTMKFCLLGFECFQYIQNPFVIKDTFFPMVELTHRTNDICKYAQNFYPPKKGTITVNWFNL